MDTFIISIIETRKLRGKKVKQIAQGHSTRKGWEWIFISYYLALESDLLAVTIGKTWIKKIVKTNFMLYTKKSKEISSNIRPKVKHSTTTTKLKAKKKIRPKVNLVRKSYKYTTTILKTE